MTAMTEPADTGRRLTGRKVLLILVGFFGVIFAVNFVFIYYALSTFPGLAVASSYKAGQEYEHDVAEGRAQLERGWKVDGTVKPAGSDADVDFTFADKAGAALTGLDVRVQMVHAVDPTQDHSVTLAETGPGHYVARMPALPSGRWYVTIEAARGGERLFRSDNEIKLER